MPLAPEPGSAGEGREPGPDPGAAPYLLPLVVSVVAIAASLGIHAAAMRTPLRFLYRTPPFLVLDRAGRS
ncbi:hypothetical protein [Clavibacter michiganensis]|uniref:Uncharacterized protein n=1 Tax=Clavibacter michiganensis TaxID=28447 RepID=A0A251YMP3_9MICO|nr:hypothetical protein [Clavibacter michiganensis]OUE25505.1 hypothetical protein BFL37_05840 [Clavibacter michiganensis]